MARWAEDESGIAMRIAIEEALPQERDASEGFLQSSFWGEFKSDFGWKARHFALVDAEGRRAPLLVLERSLGKGLSFAYIPHGPEIDAPVGERSALLGDIARALRPRLGRGCLFARFDPPWYEVEPAQAASPDRGDEAAGEGGAPGAGERRAVTRPTLGAPLRRAAADIQPPDTVLLDLGKTEAELLAGMKPKWRYNVRLAEKKGVAVEERGAAALSDFYRLYEATSARDRIALHPRRYYERLFSLAAERGAGDAHRPDLRLWVASLEGEDLAAIVTLFRGRRAVYLYGASSDSHRNLMPAYALQWTAIRAAKAAGCSEYDFYGIPPTDAPSHPMAGLYRFKTGFGGAIVHRAGSWDYPLRPLLYEAFRATEAARTWYFKDFRKRFRKGQGA